MVFNFTYFKLTYCHILKYIIVLTSTAYCHGNFYFKVKQLHENLGDTTKVLFDLSKGKVPFLALLYMLKNKECMQLFHALNWLQQCNQFLFPLCYNIKAALIFGMPFEFNSSISPLQWQMPLVQVCQASVPKLVVLNQNFLLT